MKKKIIFIGLLLVTSANGVYAKERTPFIDPMFEKHEKEVNSLILKCEKKAKNITQEIQCTSKVPMGFSNDLMRGHTLYCEKNYLEAGHDYEGMKKVFYRLKEEQAIARRELDDFRYQEYRKTGEVTAEMFESEIRCVESQLAKMQMQDIKRMRKENNASN